jgi:thioesterase domain-containing protein
MMNVHARLARLSPAQRELLARRLRLAVDPRWKDGDAEVVSSLVAYLELHGTDGIDDVRRHVSARLPAHMVPSRLIPIDALPLLPNGKIDRQSLIDRAVAAGGSTTAAATNSVEAQLMRIWDDLIDFREIGRDDNFFELGGHSLLVPRLTDRVQRDFGVSLPIAAVFQAPTVRQLAEVIREQGPKQVVRCVVAIRESGDRPPLFMIHGLGGEIGYFYNLAEYLDPQQPVYGVQSPPEPFDRIEPMAAHYVKEIRSRYPCGPFFLAGYCVGGCVAYEMARQLVASGDSVPFLVLVDSVMPGPQSLRRRLKRFSARPVRDMLEIVGAKISEAASRFTKPRVEPTARAMTLYGVPQAFQAVARRHFDAQRAYAPGPYPGDMWLFRSTDNAFDDDLGWGPLVRGRLEVRNVPGAHSDVLKEPNLRETARQLKSVLDTTVV